MQTTIANKNTDKQTQDDFVIPEAARRIIARNQLHATRTRPPELGDGDLASLLIKESH